MMEGTRPAEACNGFERSLRDYYGCFDVSPIEARQDPLGWHFHDVTAGPFRGCRISAERMYSSRPPLPDNWASSGFILANFGPTVTVEHHGHRASIASGDMILLDSRAGCSITTHELTDSVCLNVSRDRLNRMGFKDAATFGVPISGRHGPGSLVQSMLRTLLAQNEESDPLDQHVMTDVTVQLLFAALGKERDEFSLRDNHLQVIEQMKDWALQHLGEARLNTQSLATEFHYSVRGLYRLFARIGTTPHEWLWEQRLSEGNRLLQRADSLDMSITDIAHSTGFSDSSHFARRFRKRFGHAPGKLRKPS